jgi:hypothetical protein
MWQRANPAIGKRITVEYVTKERRSLPPREFARERMGWWDPPAVSAADADRSPLNLDWWDASTDDDPANAPSGCRPSRSRSTAIRPTR